MGPNREDYSSRGAYKAANEAFVQSLLGLTPEEPVDVASMIEAQNEVIKKMGRQVAALHRRLEHTATVRLEGHDPFAVHADDHLTISLSMMVAARGKVVDLPLSSGLVISGLRIGELTEITQQLIAQREPEQDNDSGLTE